VCGGGWGVLAAILQTDSVKTIECSCRLKEKHCVGLIYCHFSFIMFSFSLSEYKMGN